MTTDTATRPLVQLRAELADTKAELRRTRKDRDRALRKWTEERARMIGERRELRAQIRNLERALYRYLAAEVT